MKIRVRGVCGGVVRVRVSIRVRDRVRIPVRAWLTPEPLGHRGGISWANIELRGRY